MNQLGIRTASFLFGVAVLGASLATQAANTYLSNVEILFLKTYVDNKFGGCVAQVDQDITVDGTGTLTNCNQTNIVSFDCKGEFLTKSASSTQFQAAQLAFVTRRYVDITIKDNQVHSDANGSKTTCYANGVIVKEEIPATP